MNVCWYCINFKTNKGKEPCVSCGKDKKNYKLWLVKESE